MKKQKKIKFFWKKKFFFEKIFDDFFYFEYILIFYSILSFRIRIPLIFFNWKKMFYSFSLSIEWLLCNGFYSQIICYFLSIRNCVDYLWNRHILFDTLITKSFLKFEMLLGAAQCYWSLIRDLFSKHIKVLFLSPNLIRLYQFL